MDQQPIQNALEAKTLATRVYFLNRATGQLEHAIANLKMADKTIDTADLEIKHSCIKVMIAELDDRIEAYDVANVVVPFAKWAVA